MKKLLLSLLFVLFLFFPKSSYADQDFDISAKSTYVIADNGLTTISQKVAIVNKKDFIYTPSYSVTIGFDKLTNVRVFDEQGVIPFVVNKENGQTTIEISFRQKTVGVGKITAFTLSFDTDTVTKQNGSIWEVDIPGLANPESFNSYDLTLTVPRSFNTASIVKPPHYTKTSPNTYVFTKQDVGSAGVFMLFGDVQYYKLKLDYHISNSNLFPIKTEIALPPSTGYQDVSIKSLKPAPKNVYQDKDGNWLAVYELLPSQKQTITSEVIVKVFSIPKDEKADTSVLSQYVKGAQYWNIDDARVKKIASSLSTPKNIYDYVVSTLKYNYDKVSDTNARLGAVNVLKNPDNAVCLEFTDLFVTLARAAGIPARAVEGYAFTENSKLRPLSLVKDVLHAWPEYYDKEQDQWIMVDPTWGNTTKGSDYFTTLDYDHIAFVINGLSSSYPIPAGGYKFSPDSKDVNVEFASAADFAESTQANVTLSLPEFALSGLPVTGSVIIKNIGSIAIHNKEITVNSTLSPHSQTFTTDEIPPFGEKEVRVHFDRTPLFSNGSLLTTTEYQVTILFDGNTVRKVIKIGLFTEQMIIILGGGISLAAIIILIIAIKTRRVLVQK